MQHLNDKLCCPQCGHNFRASEQKLKTAAPKVHEPAAQFDRKAALERAQAEIASRLQATGKPWFGKGHIGVTTNEGVNVGTPIAVTVKFKDGKTRTARAGVLNPNVDLFIRTAVADIARWADLVYGGSVSAG